MPGLLILCGAVWLLSLQSLHAAVLIHEVHYDVIGSDNGEYVELYNSGAEDVDLSGWYFGDEETAGGGESMSAIPGGTIICGGDYFLIARDEAEFVAHFGLTPDLIMLFALNNTGDEIILSHGYYTDYEDVVVYESGTFPGVSAHPGVTSGFSLERINLIDTDNCAVDFAGINPPTPTTANCIPPPPTEGTVSAYFNSSVDPTYAIYDPANGYQDLAELLIAQIDQTVVSLDICIYNLSLSAVSNAIIAAYNRGVSVRVIIEDDNHNSYTQSLENAGITVIDDAFGSNSGSNLMHNKFVLFDYRLDEGDADDLLWTGSFNFTLQSDVYDDNNVLVIESSELCAVYLTEFDEMWGSSGETPSVTYSKFGTNKLDNTLHAVMVDSSQVEIYFSPSDGATSQLIQLIGSADYDLYFCILSFTRTDLEDALHACLNAGIPVRGVFDNGQGNDPYSVYQNMAGSGDEPWIPPADVHLDGNGSGLLHHKYLLIDPQHPDSDPIVITGSMNWSTSGGFYNDENMIVIHDPHIADQYFQEFAARFIQAGGVLSPGVTEVTIGEIQYSEDPSGNSPYTGVTVTTSGLVTAAFGNGFFLSENNGTPWSGLFVFDSAVLPAVGDSLTLTGTVTEYYELTELDNVTTATLHNSGLTPVPIAISCLEAASEQHEGCFLQLDDLIVVDPDLGFGEWSVSDGTGTLVIDDMGSYSYIPQAGDPIEQLTGPLTYSFGVFKLEPRDDGDIVLLLPGVNDLTITTDGNSVHLSWTAIPGATTYRVYAANTAFFTPLPENLVTETALQYYDEIVAGGSRFYRVVALN